MQRSPLHVAAAGASLAMAALLALLVVVPPGVGIPPVLAGLFIGLWTFGAVMLWYVPLVGAAGTAAWGFLSGFQALAMHGTTPRNLLVVVASLATGALALAFLVQRWRRR